MALFCISAGYGFYGNLVIGSQSSIVPSHRACLPIYSKMAKEVIAITGATQGLGLEMARWFISKGHTVVGCGRSATKIEQLSQQYRTNGTAKFSVVDITCDDTVQKWAQESVNKFGPPTFLLNNAGFANGNANLWEVPQVDFDKVMDINIKGPANVIRHFVPAMVKAKRGVIVNFSSGWGRSVAPLVAPYCATKWAIEGLSKALALELPAPMVCVPLNPGTINTSMLETVFGQQRASVQQSPEEWAQRACPYILSIDRLQNGSSLAV